MATTFFEWFDTFDEQPEEGEMVMVPYGDGQTTVASWVWEIDNSYECPDPPYQNWQWLNRETWETETIMAPDCWCRMPPAPTEGKE